MYKDKNKQRKYQRKHYLANKELYVRRSSVNKKKAIIRNKIFVKAFLETHSCVDCGIRDIRVLEFDHIKGVKKESISALVGAGYSIKAIQLEMKKCMVRCANCHRIKTFNTIWK